MTDIGHAQRRLLDDDASSAGHFLPSTATPHLSEVSQSGSFPSVTNYPYHQMNEMVNDNYMSTRTVVEDSYQVTQLVEPTHVNGYDYSTPATSNNVESPFDDPNEQVDTLSTSVQLNHDTPSHKSTQRSKSMQSQLWSPHDTEPLSSVVSPRLSRSKSDNARSGLRSLQHSEGSAHDELALPMMVPVTAADTSALRKKRGRPKKQSLPEDDEDDELAAPRDYGFEMSKTAEERRPGLSPKTQETARQDAIEINGDADEPPTNEVKSRSGPGLMVVLPVAFDGKSRSNDAGGSTESGTADTKRPKKKKVKRSKTASAVLDKPKGTDIDDDVIWLDSNPLQMDENKPTERADDPQRAPEAPPQVNNETPQVEEAPESRKRGRKRKKATDQLAAEANLAPEVHQQPPETETVLPDNAPTTEENPDSAPEPLDETKGPTQETKDTKPPPQQDSATNEVFPHTPQRAEGKENDPAIAKGSHKGPTKHSPILSTTKVPYRVGLSKRARIAPLLKVVRK